MESRRAPCWKFVLSGRETRGSIDWGEHLAIWNAYVAKNQYRAQYFRFLSPERIAESGGFSYAAATKLLGHPPNTWQQAREPDP